MIKDVLAAFKRRGFIALTGTPSGEPPRMRRLMNFIPAKGAEIVYLCGTKKKRHHKG